MSAEEILGGNGGMKYRVTAFNGKNEEQGKWEFATSAAADAMCDSILEDEKRIWWHCTVEEIG